MTAREPFDPAKREPALRLYVDDSGNTGPDLLSTDQPVGVTAMLLLDAHQEDELSAAIDRSRGEAPHRLPPELKFSRISRTGEGRRVLRDVMAALGHCGARLFFGITEKRYMAANLVVETFLDPLWTDGLPLELLTRVERRKAANLVYETCDDFVLSEFLAATRREDQAGVVSAGERVAARLDLHPAEDAPRVAWAVRQGIEDPFDWSKESDEPPLLKRPTANTFTFLSVISVVERHLRDTGGVAEMIADEDKQFGPILAGAFRMGLEARHFPGGVSAYGTPGPIRQIRARKERVSQDELGIQAADLAAGLIAAVAQDDMRGEDPSHEEPWNEMLSILPSVECSSYWNVSERMLARLTRSFGDMVPPRDGWSWCT